MRRAFLSFVMICFSGVVYGQTELSTEPNRLIGFKEYFQKEKNQKISQISSTNFEVYWVNARDALISKALLMHLEAAYQELGPLFLSKKTSQKIPVEIYPDLYTFSAVSKLPLARFRATGTIALTLDQRLMLLSPRNSASGYSWAETAVHELVHYLVREISPDYIPIWLHEGVAQVYQGYPVEKESSLKPSQWGLFKKFKEKDALLSLQALYEPFPYKKDPEEAELSYIQALLFVQWIEKKCGVLELIRLTGSYRNLNSALEQCTGQKIESLKKEFIPKIMNGIKIPIDRDVEYYALDLSGQKDVEVEGRKADKKSRDFALISSKLFNQGRYRGAAYEMEKALKFTPVAPPSWRRQLAASYKRSRRHEDFEKILHEVVQDYPNDAGSWYLLAQKAIEDKKFKLARSYYLKAFYHNPFLDGLEADMRLLGERQSDLAFKFLP